MNGQRIAAYAEAVKGKSSEDIVRWAVAAFGRDRLVLASSFGAEDQVLTHMMSGIEPRARIVTLDTGRLFPETYDVMQRTRQRYNVRFEVVVPDAADLSAMLSEHGPNLFYESREQRKLCCDVRKIRPLRKALTGADAWICGLRSGQGETRVRIEPVEWDAVFGLIKVNPLHDWTEEQVWEYLRSRDVPYNALHDRGFPSIGCAPCTRAVRPGEDPRAGRWWWESKEERECGLHWKDGRAVRA